MRSYSKKRDRNRLPAKLAKGRRVLTVRARPGVPTQGLLNSGDGLVFRCALGRGGISAMKREGDGATPLAAMRLLSGYLRERRFGRRSALPLLPITADLGWCEVPEDRNYNRPVRIPYGASHETMLRPDGLYDACVVLDWNIRPRRRGCGSAIFFHLARPGFQPTAGCVAVSRAVMARLLPLLSKRTVLVVRR
jgi:L,D-peptidoglycan transpeptidase YkuD (ErfK/YbiS/YcfS/YnhG family)